MTTALLTQALERNAALSLDLARVLEERDALTQKAARYEWIRAAYVDFDDNEMNEALLPLSFCYTPEEVDAAIDAELVRAASDSQLSAA